MMFRDCNYPKFIVFLLGTQALFFLYLFGSFYHKTYIRSGQKAKKLSESENNNIKNGKLKTK